MNICSPGEVTRLRRGELCRELSQAASNLNIILSSPGISRYSPETAFFTKIEAANVEKSNLETGQARVRNCRYLRRLLILGSF